MTVLTALPRTWYATLMQMVWQVLMVATLFSQKSGRAPYGAERLAVRRNSKGKEKAAESAALDFPQPSFSITGSDDEADLKEPIQHAPSPDPLVPTSGSLVDEESQATTLSKSWVEEEGEVFRKGHVLLGPQELGEEGAAIDSEELKREVGALNKSTLEFSGSNIPHFLAPRGPSRTETTT
jgi:hypothetical protein